MVKAFVRTAHEISRFDDANQALMNRTIRASQLMAIFSPFMLLLLNLTIVSAVWLGGRFALSGEMSVGHVVAAINYLSFALFPILLLGGMLGPLSAAEASAIRILEILDDESQVRPPERPVTIGHPRGRIVFEQVAFSYNGNGAEPVLCDVSFTAEPGETVAILGATGSGKSTLIHLIARFYDVTTGRITFDGTDLHIPVGRTVRENGRASWLISRTDPPRPCDLRACPAQAEAGGPRAVLSNAPGMPKARCDA